MVVDDKYAHSRDHSFARKVMLEFLDAHKEQCGITAPHFRIYSAFMIIRSEKKHTYLEMLNPSISKSKIDRVHRKSTVQHVICEHGNNTTYDSPTVLSVDVEYTNLSGNRVSLTLENGMAMCAYHYIALIDGVWPCSKQTSRFPQNPHLFYVDEVKQEL